jgi:hypothetical protein
VVALLLDDDLARDEAIAGGCGGSRRSARSAPRWCRSPSGSGALSTSARSPDAPTWRAGLGMQGIRPGPWASAPRGPDA